MSDEQVFFLTSYYVTGVCAWVWTYYQIDDEIKPFTLAFAIVVGWTVMPLVLIYHFCRVIAPALTKALKTLGL